MNNKKNAVLTFHRAYNYGAVLQCYALTKAIKKLGQECEVLDYWPEYFRNIYYFEKNFSLLHPPVRTWIKKLKVRKILKTRNQNFEKFIKEYIEISGECYRSIDELKKVSEKYHKYVVGSDQVWNDTCAKFDPVYFLDFNAANQSQKYSYAASFGFSKVPQDKYMEYKRRLSGYNDYSVREVEGASIIQELINKEVKVCCDPTLLLSMDEWNLLVKNEESEPYILVYYVTETTKLQEYALEIAREKQCKVICVPCNMKIEILSGKKDKEFNVDVRTTCSPNEFLSLVKNARYVLTNSFHGTVFSILFHKKFILQSELENGKINSRGIELLNKVHLEDRIMSNKEKNILYSEIDWVSVDKKIELLRKESLLYLNSIFQEDSRG